MDIKINKFNVESVNMSIINLIFHVIGICLFYYYLIKFGQGSLYCLLQAFFYKITLFSIGNLLDGKLAISYIETIKKYKLKLIECNNNINSFVIDLIISFMVNDCVLLIDLFNGNKKQL